MNILVIGCDFIGRKLALELDTMGHDVVIVDEDAKNLEELDPKFGGVVFRSFPMDVNDLKNAGIENCDAVAVVTTDDNLNITVGQIAKNIFGIKNVVTRISDPDREFIFESFGFKTICPTNLAGSSITTALLAQEEGKQITLGHSTLQFDVVDVTPKMVDMRISELRCSPGEVPFAILNEDGKVFLCALDKDYLLQENEKIVLARRID